MKLTPQGPAQAVKVPATLPAQGPDGGGAAGIARPSGWPESIRERSCSGPFGPIFHGVWQSLHPPIVTRYSPRFTTALPADGFGAASAAPPTTATAAAAHAAQMNVFMCVVSSR